MMNSTSHTTSVYLAWVVKPKPNSLEVFLSLRLTYFTADGHKNTHLLLFTKKLNMNSLLLTESRLWGRRFLHSGVWRHICLCGLSTQWYQDEYGAGAIWSNINLLLVISPSFKWRQLQILWNISSFPTCLLEKKKMEILWILRDFMLYFFLISWQWNRSSQFSTSTETFFSNRVFYSSVILRWSESWQGSGLSKCQQRSSSLIADS